MGLAGVYAVVRPGVEDGAALRDPAGALRRLAVEVADEIRTRGG
jgi:hypothetical protein